MYCYYRDIFFLLRFTIHSKKHGEQQRFCLFHWESCSELKKSDDDSTPLLLFLFNAKLAAEAKRKRQKVPISWKPSLWASTFFLLGVPAGGSLKGQFNFFVLSSTNSLIILSPYPNAPKVLKRDVRYNSTKDAFLGKTLTETHNFVLSKEIDFLRKKGTSTQHSTKQSGKRHSFFGQVFMYLCSNDRLVYIVTVQTAKNI